MIEVIILVLIIAKVKGYKIKPVFKQWRIYPIILFVIIYLCLNIGVFLGNYNMIKYAGLIEAAYIFSFFFLIYKYKLYKSAFIGSISMIIGTILNKIAIRSNNGKMPVFPTLSYYTGYYKPGVFDKVNDIHILGDSSTSLKFLTDVVDIGYSILSIGDLFIRFFTFIIIYNAIKTINKTWSREGEKYGKGIIF